MEAVDFTQRFPSVEVWWESQVRRSMRTADAVSEIDAATRAELLAELAVAAAPWTRPDGALALPSRSWVAWAEA
jgi:hypothetical protein